MKTYQIAVVLAGIDEEYQGSIMEGVTAAAKDLSLNIACFSSYGGVLGNQQYDIGEYNIYSLINFERFDGVILLTNCIGSTEQRYKVINQAAASGVPTVVLDSDENPSFYNIRIDNATAMREIVQHVITEHGAKVINYISGPLVNPEARARYETFLQVMAENRLTADARRVYFGEFRPIDGINAAKAFLASDMPMPDAIIAANDAMALEAMAVLQQNGIRVPEDVIVTGFDNTYYARNHCPSLTSVDRPLYDAGYAACATLLKVFQGEECEKTITFSAEPAYHESCGCGSEELDIKAYRRASYEMVKRTRTDISLLNRMTSGLAEAESVEENIKILGKFLQEIDCSQCCICLCSDWQNAFRDEQYSLNGTETQFRVQGYSKTMSAPLVWTKDSIRTVECFSSAEMFPLPMSAAGNVHYFFPLHYRERCLGYYIISNSDFPLKSMLCHSMMMNISHSLENVRKLLQLNNAIRELERLYVIDPLCGIYNRNGFIRYADKMFKQCMARGENLLISFIDMDGLKLINDQFGHDEGDFALQQLARIISNTCTDNQICARFGGDEFIIVGTDADENDGALLETRFQQLLADKCSILHKPYFFGASIGTFITPVTNDMCLFSLITEADKIMYEQKKRKKTSRYLRNE